MRQIFSIALAGLAICVWTIPADAQISQEQRDILIAVYNSAGGAGWSDRTNWRNPGDTDFNTAGTECTWFGVVCSVEETAVRELNLRDNNLGGTIPSQLGSLDSITTLDLGSNQLTGGIPTTLGGLSALAYLRLDSNQLTGNIPGELGDLGELRELALQSNQLDGAIPAELGIPKFLRSITLSSNQLSGSIPPEIGDLSALQWFYASDNALTGSIPTTFGGLTNLNTLNLSTNQISGGIPSELGGLSSLRYLVLNNNQLTGGIPPAIGGLNSLIDLNLSSNQLTGSLPSALSGLSSLVFLNLSSNQIVGAIPGSLGGISSLRLMNLSANRISGAIPTELDGLVSLEWLYLQDNNLDGSFPESIGGLTSLRTLNIQHNRLDGTIPAAIGGLSSLMNLNIGSNMFSGSIPIEFTNLTTLTDSVGCNVSWNAVFSDNQTVVAFIDQKQAGGYWQSTETLAPTSLQVTSVSDYAIWLSWNQIVSPTEHGGYEVFYSLSDSGVWTSGGWTASKNVTAMPVSGLTPGTLYDFAVVTFTDPHVFNLNTVQSGLSAIVVASTSNVGCAAPAVSVALGSTSASLEVTEVFDSYLWNTGETTQSITVDPPYGQWYWVTVTSAGSCQETTSLLVKEVSVFYDGFETGTTTAWSSTFR